MKITFIKTGKRVKKKENSNQINKVISSILEDNIGNKENKNRNKNENKNKNLNSNFKRLERKENKVDNKKMEVKKKEATKNKTDKFFEVMKPVFRKNQLVLLTLALMLVTAGYMNYNNKSVDELNISLAEIGDARLVSTNVTETNDDNEVENQEETLNEVKGEENVSNIENQTVANDVKEENIVDTNSNVQNVNTNYFIQTRLERETMYSQMQEAYEKILENESVPADQKAIASNEIKNINDRKNAISIIENLIKTKGFEDAVLLINDNSINVMIKSKENLKTEEVAQITNIVSRELKADIENIHISTHY